MINYQVEKIEMEGIFGRDPCFLTNTYNPDDSASPASNPRVESLDREKPFNCGVPLKGHWFLGLLQ